MHLMRHGFQTDGIIATLSDDVLKELDEHRNKVIRKLGLTMPTMPNHWSFMHDKVLLTINNSHDAHESPDAWIKIFPMFPKNCSRRQKDECTFRIISFPAFFVNVGENTNYSPKSFLRFVSIPLVSIRKLARSSIPWKNTRRREKNEWQKTIPPFSYSFNLGGIIKKTGGEKL